jgi:GntR family transcriptional regulator
MAASTDPVYLRVLEDLREQIRGGVLAPGARVPSRNGIIARYGVGETAAKHALQVLATEGLIEARAGSGSYVRRVPAASHLEHDRLHFPGSPFGLEDPQRAAGGGTADRGPADGEAHSPRLSWEHQSERVAALPHIARLLRVEPGDAQVTRTRYLLCADGTPVQMVTSYEPAELTAHTPVPFPEQGPFAGRGVIERMKVISVYVDQVVEEISVRPSLSAEAAALDIPAGAPVLLIERAHRAGQRTVEVGEILIAADRFRLRYRIPVAPGPDQRGSDQRGSDQNGSDQNGSDQNGPDRRGPDQNGPGRPGTGDRYTAEGQGGAGAALPVGAGVIR